MNDKIEYILQEFSEYLTTREDIDVIHSKFGYLFLHAVTHQKKEFNITILASPEHAYECIIDFLVQEYLYEKHLDAAIVPKENMTEFCQWMGNYMHKVPEYRYILDCYIEKD